MQRGYKSDFTDTDTHTQIAVADKNGYDVTGVINLVWCKTQVVRLTCAELARPEKCLRLPLRGGKRNLRAGVNESCRTIKTDKSSFKNKTTNNSRGNKTHTQLRNIQILLDSRFSSD